jgi:hypothetical protein
MSTDIESRQILPMASDVPHEPNYASFFSSSIGSGCKRFRGPDDFATTRVWCE